MGPNLTWTKKQTDIVMGVLKFEGSAKSVTRALKHADVFSEGHFPSSSQINAMIAYCRSILIKRIDIFDTHELREKIAEKLEVLDEDTESYIVYHHIDDEHELKEPLFVLFGKVKSCLPGLEENSPRVMQHTDFSGRVIHFMCQEGLIPVAGSSLCSPLMKTQGAGLVPIALFRIN